MSYSAVVCCINKLRKHENADKLLLATCLGNQVVVGLDTHEEELGIFFSTDGQLSEQFCEANGLYTKAAMDKLGLSHGLDHKFGFFDHKRRIRAQRFRGEKSDGIFLPLNSLSWTGSDPLVLKEGDQLAEFGGYTICNKYLTPATLRAMLGQKIQRKESKYFPKHDVTKQFRFFAEDIPEDAVIWISEKVHGTQGRLAHALDEVLLGRVKRWINYAGSLISISIQPFPTQQYAYLNASKNVILEKADSRNSWYGTDEFRYNVTEGVTLHKGEVIYFEIVGWVNETTPIMPPHDVTKTGLKDIRAKYGDTIHYTYGCPAGTHRMYVYKIMQVNTDGVAVDLSWPQVVGRCRELRLSHVPVLAGPYAYNQLHSEGMAASEILRSLVEAHISGSSTLNPAQIREGVVVRVESSTGTGYLKSKAFEFGVLEGYLSEDDSFIDPESVS